MGSQEYELNNTIPQFVEEMKDAVREATERYGDFTRWDMEDFVDHYFQEVEELNEELAKNHIHCSVRKGRLRVSPHFYNTHEEIDEFIERIR